MNNRSCIGDPALFNEAITRFDASNAADPDVIEVDGVAYPAELVYGRRMTDRLLRFAPGASEALQLAARSQHIRRWEIPRSDFADGRVGYHRWRNALAKFHADVAGRILHDVGYDQATIERVQFLLQKKKLKLDAESQCLEDVACLVFIEFYFEGFSAQHDDEKLIGIIRRTIKKMSVAAVDEATRIDVPERLKRIIGCAAGG